MSPFSGLVWLFLPDPQFLTSFGFRACDGSWPHSFAIKLPKRNRHVSQVNCFRVKLYMDVKEPAKDSLPPILELRGAWFLFPFCALPTTRKGERHDRSPRTVKELNRADFQP
jgi:hypothetical protein